MDLDLSQEQQMLRETVRSFCEAEIPSAVVRAAEQNAEVGRGVISRLGSLGVMGLRISPDRGGVGLGLTELVVAYSELGRTLTPGPHVDSGVLAAGLLARLGGRESRALMESVASGEKIAVVAWQEPSCRGDLGSMSTKVRAGEGSLHLAGEKHFVPYAGLAERIIVPAVGPTGEVAFYLVDPTSSGIEITSQGNLSDEPLARVRFTDTPVELLSSPERAEPVAAWRSTLAEVQIASAALCSGGAERILEITTAYAAQREQFGRPIGSFQSIAHSLADAAIAVEGARILTYRAASAGDGGKAFAHYARMAKLKSAATFRSVSALAIQIHGGLGFTEAADPQLYFRRAKHHQLMYGEPAWLERAISDDLFDGTYLVFDQ